MILLLFFPYTYSKTCHKVFFATGSIHAIGVSHWLLIGNDLRVNKMKPDKEGRHPAGL